jgi:GTP-binding protein
MAGPCECVTGVAPEETTRLVKVLGVEFLKSAASRDDFPRDAIPQLALVGRSNVGKSSLINALTRSKVARTSAAPGKTRLLNLYLVRGAGGTPERLYLVDLPGYGYARGGARAATSFEALVGEYFAHAPWERPAWQESRQASPRGAEHPGTRRPPRPAGPTAAVLLVDARHPGLEADGAALEWLVRHDRPIVVVASKIDKLARAERVRAEREWAEALNVPILPVSAVTGEGLNELWKRISKLLLPSAPSERSVPPRAIPAPTTTSPSSTSRRSRT